jgi:Zn-dependent protease
MDEARILDAVLKLGVLVFSLCLHEFGHAYAAYRLGDPTAKMLGRMTIDPRAHVDLLGTIVFPLLMFLYPGLWLIGWAKPVPVTQENFLHPRRDMTLVALAGPCMNLFLAFLSILGLWFSQQAGLLNSDPEIGLNVPKLLLLFLFINFFLAIFNLVPLPPLDGGWLLKAILPGPWAYRLARLEPYSIILIYVLLWFGILNLLFIPAALVLAFFLNLVGLGQLTGYIGL